MTQLSFSIPQVGQGRNTQEPTAGTALSDIKTAYNADHSTGGHTLGWIAPGTSGQIIVCNASGVPTYVTASGDVTTDNAGVLSIGANKVTTAKILDGNVTAAKLAADTQSAYKTLTRVEPTHAGNATTGTYYFGFEGSNAGTSAFVLVASGTATNLTGGGASTKSGPQGLIYFDDADYAFGSLTQKLRIRQQVTVGATSPSTVTLNCGLYPVTIAAGAWTLGTVVANSATSTTGLATNTISSFTSASGDFTVPSDGVYCLGVVVGSITCPIGIQISAQLQSRNV